MIFPGISCETCGLSLSVLDPTTVFSTSTRGYATMGVTTAAVHPSDQTLSAYGLGKLDDASAETVSKHLEDCDSCQRRVAELSSDEFLGRLQNAQVKSDKSAADWPPSGVSSTEGARGPVVPPPPVDTLPPELVDHPDYEIVRELGRGGMGVVYLARNKLMGRLEVLKVVGGQLVERPGVRDRFLREVQSAAKLQHKNIVAAYSAMRLGESIVLAMEYIDGEDLAKMVKSRGPLPVVHACYFIYQAALGLQHAHERGMVHRDIKPANLIFAIEGKKGVVKVLDFGLAKVTSEGQADSGLTREGQMLGTPDYIAPEQIRDAQSADIRADIYSLGCTFYYLLTGGPPFRGDHLWDLYQAHFSMDAGPLNLVRPEVPVELAAVVAKMMAKEPGRRFQTPGEVAQALVPFFKKGSAAVRGANAEFSQAGQPDAKPATPGAVSVPTRPTTETTPAPFSEARKPDPSRQGSIPEGLIDLGEREPLFDTMLDGIHPAEVPKPSQRAPRPWSTAVEKLSRSGPRRVGRRRCVAARVGRRLGSDSQGQDRKRDDRAGEPPEGCRGPGRRRGGFRRLAGRRQARGDHGHGRHAQGHGQEGWNRDIRQRGDRAGGR